MEETNQTLEPTTTEPTVVETTEPAVVEQPTPMDDNVTYNSLPDSATKYDPNLDATQNMANQIVKVTGAINEANNSGKAMNRFLTQEYNYNPEEAGSYWVAGGINDKDTQMSFLNTIINEEMYDEMDLQKYYYDNTMATARAYAANKEKETAYGFYRAAQEKAISEAQLTGWYMPAEGQYMLANYEAAQATINNKDAKPEDVAKAKRISGVAEQWFAANKISTRGMKCLSMMNYEESVRHNTIMGELKKEANKIAAQGNAITAAGNKLKLREFKFRMEEAELDQGINYTNILGLDNKGIIGHDFDDPEYAGLTGLKGYRDLEHAYQDPTLYNSILTAYGRQYLNSTLKAAGLDPVKYEINYQGDNQRTNAQSYIDSNPGTTTVLPDKCTEATGKKINVDGNTYELRIGYTDDGKVFAGIMYDDKSWRPLTEGNYKILDSDGKTVEEYINDRFEQGVADFSGVKSINVSGKEYFIGTRPAVESPTSTKSLTKNSGWGGRIFNENGFLRSDSDIKLYQKDINKDIMNAQSSKGIKDKDGKVHNNLTVLDGWVDTTGYNSYVVFKDADGNYYSLSNDHTISKVDEKKLKQYTAKDVEKYLKEGNKVVPSPGGKDSPYITKEIYKGSYEVSSRKEKGRTYSTMCYIIKDKDGNVEKTIYYELEHKGNGFYKITQSNMSEKDVIKKGGTPFGTNAKSKNISDTTYYNVNKNGDAITGNKDNISDSTSYDIDKDGNVTTKVKGYDYNDGSFIETVSGNGTNNNPTYEAMSSETRDASYNKYSSSSNDSGADLLERMHELEQRNSENIPEKFRNINNVKEAK